MIKQKSLGLMVLSILSLILLVGLVSASSNLTISALPSGDEIDDNEDPFNFTFDVTYNGTADDANISFSGSTADFDGTDNLTVIINEGNSLTGLNGTENETGTVNGAIFGFDGMGSGTINVEVVAEATTPGDNDTETFTVNVLKEVDFCSNYNNSGNLDVRIDRVNINEGFGDDEVFWYPLDEVEIEVEVENEGDWDVEDIEIEFCLYDLKEEKCIMDEGDVELSEDDFDLDEGDEIDLEITFQVDPKELYAGNNNYKYYVTATGTIDDRDADEKEKDGEKTCFSEEDEIEVVTDDFFVVINDITLNEEIIACGEELRIDAEVWNVGDEDMDDDEVFVLIYSKELGINKVVEFPDGIESMDKENLNRLDYFGFEEETGLTFTIPTDLEEKYYKIDMIVFDDEDMDEKDVYENKEDDLAEYAAYVKVEGECYIKPEVELTASLESEAKAGEKLKLLVNIANTGDETKTYSLSATGYETWASIEEFSEDLVLEAGEVMTGYILFDVNEDVSGKQTFDIRVISDNKVVLIQPYEVDVEESKGGFFSGITGSAIVEDEYFPYLLGIGILNIILILGIIVLAVRLGRRQ